MIVVDQLVKSFKGHVVVDGISFQLQPNTLTVLVGANGAGKTTLLSMIAGLLKPSSGTMIFPKSIGFLPQYPKFFPDLTAYEFLKLCGEIERMPDVSARIKEVLQLVGLTNAAHKRIGTFSGGMKQRLGIAQAILHKPKLLLLDEPVSALDPVGRRDVMELLLQLKTEMTILFSTHVLHDAQQLADDVLFMKDGKLVDISLSKQIEQVHIELKNKEDVERLKSLLQIEQTDGCHMYSKDLMEKVLTVITQQSIAVLKVEQIQPSLEQLFMEVVSE